MTSDADAHHLRLDFDHVTIGILNALTEEYSACCDIFDPEQTSVETQRTATSGTLTCRICQVPAKHGGEHIVAIALLPNMGNTAAAIAANILLQHCTSIKYLIMCGIAGAVPDPGNHADHVRLGDIVVSDRTGIVQYDFGKQRDPRKEPEHPFAGLEFRGAPRPPSPELLAAVARMHAAEMKLSRTAPREWEEKVDRYLNASNNVSKWKRPSATSDKLIDTPDGKGSEIQHPKGNARRQGKPRVFHGPIGAANVVLADPAKRDALRQRWKIKAVEMEGIGVADASWVAGVGYLVVRGTCDYCNSTKNDVWHHYAALIAAAYARTVVEYLHPDGRRPLASYPGVPQAPSHLPDSGGITPGLKPLTSSGFAGGNVLFADQGSHPNKQEPPTPLNATHAPPAAQSVERQSLSAPVSVSVSAVPAPSAEYRRVRELNERLRPLIRESRVLEFKPLAEELERIISTLPRVGSDVREAWILLGTLETQRQLHERAAGRPVAVTRLRQLREEALRVID